MADSTICAKDADADDYLANWDERLLVDYLDRAAENIPNARHCRFRIRNQCAARI